MMKSQKTLSVVKTDKALRKKSLMSNKKSMMRSTFARTSEVDEHQNQMNFLFEENDDILDIESDELIENILLFIDFNISVF